MKHLIVLCFLGTALLGCSQSTEPPSTASFTAKSKLGEADSLAQSYKQGMHLMSVRSSSVSLDGTSSTWQYLYSCSDTATPPTLYWFLASSDGVAFDSTSPMGVGTSVITDSWFNSDQALRIAEQNGGARFRSSNPDYVISASLGQPVVANPTTYWYVSYTSAGDKSKSLFFSIDANTGAVKTYGAD